MKIKIQTFRDLKAGLSQWRDDRIEIAHGLFACSPIFIEEFDELVVDSETVLTKGGLGTAVAGGLLFGGAGAVAGAVLGRGNKKSSAIEVTLLNGGAFMADVDSEFLSRVKSVLFLMKGKTREERLAIVERRKSEFAQKRKKKWIERAITAVIVIAIVVFIGTKLP